MFFTLLLLLDIEWACTLCAARGRDWSKRSDSKGFAERQRCSGDLCRASTHTGHAAVQAAPLGCAFNLHFSNDYFGKFRRRPPCRTHPSRWRRHKC